jgi:hypothetical protein
MSEGYMSVGYISVGYMSVGRYALGRSYRGIERLKVVDGGDSLHV